MNKRPSSSPMADTDSPAFTLRRVETFHVDCIEYVDLLLPLDESIEPILSRFRVFSPTAAQAIEIAREVAASVHQRFPCFEPPERRLVTLLAHLTPREQIQALEDASARAQVNGRKHLARQDLPTHVTNDHASDGTSSGFWR